MDIHIGNTIEKLLRQKQMSVRELATQINYTPQAVHRILKRDLIDPYLLEAISKALDHNLFQYVYLPPKEIIQQNESDEIKILRKEMEDLKKENGYLKEINELQKKRKK
ncbi:MAG: hypothetical protein HY841_14720 [Bacteroidetes bacterium]|nr:hypothetical protein [Bacteroidota bacterium]